MNRRKTLELDRRDLVAGLGTLGTSLFFSGLPSQARAQSESGKFLIYLHCGSWDGYAAGLLQPTDVGKYARGVFRRSEEASSNNPNINEHIKTGQLVLNGYTRVLDSISDHVCFAAGTSQSLSHQEASTIQHTGDRVVGETGSPSWATGAAEAIAKATSSARGFVVGALPGAQVTARTPSVATSNSRDVNDFAARLSDPTSVPTGETASRFWGVLADMHRARPGLATMSPTMADVAVASVDALVRGVPELRAGSSLLTDISSALSRASVDARINTLDDAQGIIATPYNDLLQRLQLAAALAKTGLAQGMAIDLDGQDFHQGGSSVTTARSGAQIFAQLTVFWEWVKANGLQDDVLVIVSHEFTRTAYNDNSGPTNTVRFKGSDVAVESPGTDHQMAMGMVFINGRAPARSRVGGIGDGYTVSGSATLDGVPDASIPAYTSLQLVGSMLLRCFDDVFPSARELRKYWPAFQERDQISILGV
jgi:hypothetical protein